MSQNTIHQRIKSRRIELNLSMEVLGERVGVTYQTIQQWENGKTAPKRNRMKSLADALGVDVVALETGINFELPNFTIVHSQESENSVETNIAPALVGTRKIPLISYVQAGTMSEVHDPFPVGYSDTYLLTDLDLGENAFALTIKGESMLPEFKEGDRVIIDPSVCPNPGDYVVAKNGGDEATFKKYRPRGINKHGQEIFELVPLNDDFASMQSDITPMVIIGTMVEHRKYRKK